MGHVVLSSDNHQMCKMCQKNHGKYYETNICLLHIRLTQKRPGLPSPATLLFHCPGSETSCQDLADQP